MNGLLGDVLNNPLLNMGIGLLSASGPSLTPTSTGQALMGGMQFANNAQRQQQQNELIRAEMLEKSQRREATKKLQGLLGDSDDPTMGLLAEIAPEQFVSGLLSARSERAEPEVVRSLRAVGIDPLSPEGRELVIGKIRGDSTALDDLLTGLKIKETQGKLDETAGIKETERVVSNSAVADAEEALRIIDRLEKSPVPPGSTAASVIANLTGEDGSIFVPPNVVASTIASATGQPFSEADAKQFTTDYNRFNKLGAKFITEFSQLQQQQMNAGGRATNLGLDFLSRQNISTSIDPGANRLILKDVLKRQLEMAQARGYKIDNEKLARGILEGQPLGLPAKVDRELIRSDNRRNYRIQEATEGTSKRYYVTNNLTNETRELTPQERIELGIQ